VIEADPAARPFRQLARNHRLANHRLLTACARLGPGELAAPRTSFFPSIKATLNHILVIDWFYVDALHGGTLGPKAWADPEPCDTIEALRVEQTRVDERLLAYSETLTSEALASVVRIHRRDHVQVETASDVLLHLFLHDTHHRGQVHTMLSGTSVHPPQLDEFMLRGDAPTRVDELEALGWTEDDIAR
jgi:uncharacterized damage-inducible protein DinB